MARARLLKPGFFTNDELVELPFEGRLLFAGLWTIADRSGRLEDRPKRIKIELFPADAVDVDGLLSELDEHGFIHRYAADGQRLIHVPTFLDHQSPHPKEQPSRLPACYCESVSNGHVIGMPQASPSVPIAEADPIAVSIPMAEAEADAPCPGDAAAAAADEPEYPLRECMDLWTSATGTTVTRMVGDAMESALEDIPADWVKDAIRETGLAGAKSWKYTAAILERWKHEGREVAADVWAKNARQIAAINALRGANG